MMGIKKLWAGHLFSLKNVRKFRQNKRPVVAFPKQFQIAEYFQLQGRLFLSNALKFRLKHFVAISNSLI